VRRTGPVRSRPSLSLSHFPCRFVLVPGETRTVCARRGHRCCRAQPPAELKSAHGWAARPSPALRGRPVALGAHATQPSASPQPRISALAGSAESQKQQILTLLCVRAVLGPEIAAWRLCRGQAPHNTTPQRPHRIPGRNRIEDRRSLFLSSTLILSGSVSTAAETSAAAEPLRPLLLSSTRSPSLSVDCHRPEAPSRRRGAMQAVESPTAARSARKEYNHFTITCGRASGRRREASPSPNNGPPAGARTRHASA